MMAPGRHIVSDIDSNSYLYQSHPGNVVDKDYFRMSGTSMAAGVVSGLTALMLEQHSERTPGQVKYVLLNTSRSLPGDKNSKEPLADKAVFYTKAPRNTNDGLTPNTLLLQAAGATDPQSIT
jgi:subtilisin family serine protease